jgi:hypothetical protein
VQHHHRRAAHQRRGRGSERLLDQRLGLVARQHERVEVGLDPLLQPSQLRHQVVRRAARLGPLRPQELELFEVRGDEIRDPSVEFEQHVILS